MIVVDTSVWINQIRDIETPAVLTLRRVKSAAKLIVGDIVLLEVLQGARDDVHAARIEMQLRRFVRAPMLDARLARLAATHFRRLRSHGITARKTADLIIGTFCIDRDYALLSEDRDFVPMATHLGLRLA